MIRFTLLVVLLIGLLSGCAGPTSIRSIPYTIQQAGHYQLDRDLYLREGECAITIAASDVVLDPNGHALTGSGDWEHLEVGLCGRDIQNVRIANGIIHSFTYGIDINESANVHIQEVPFSTTGSEAFI